jgi:hypothetical protein
MVEPAGPPAVTLAYGREDWTTAVHLEAALKRRTQVVVNGPGHQSPAAEDPSRPLIWVESSAEWMPEVAQLMHRRTAAWLIDTHRGWAWRAHAASAFTVVFVAQQDAVERFASAGVEAAWLPLAAPAELSAAGLDLRDRPYDVAFVGRVDRGSLRDRLLKALGGVCDVAPSAGYRTPQEMMALYQSSRIVINVPLANDLNMRAFEALGSRALLVTGPMNGRKSLLGDLPIVVDRPEVADWLQIVTNALRHPDQRRADEGHQLVTGHHTYDHRALQVLGAIRDSQTQDRPYRDLAAGAAHAWMRWGNVRRTWSLSHSPRLTLAAAAMRTATIVKRSAPVPLSRATHAVATTRS